MLPFQKLLTENRNLGSFRAETTPDSATIYIYDVIVSNDAEAEFFGGVSPENFVKTLGGISVPVIHLRINSPGGDVFAARAMETALRQHSAKIVAHIDGYAASAASFLAMAADEIEIAPGAFFMIHKAWSCVSGNADDLLQTAALLEKIDATLADTYAARTGKTSEQIAAWMSDETWFTGQEAVDAGFANRVVSSDTKAQAQWNMSAYAKAPKMAVPTPIEKPVTAANDSSPHIDDLRRRLRIAEQTA